MPKTRVGKSYFAVGPWQDRQQPVESEEEEEQAQPQPAGGQGYSVVELPLVVGGGSGGSRGGGDTADLAAAPDSMAVDSQPDQTGFLPKAAPAGPSPAVEAALAPAAAAAAAAAPMAAAGAAAGGGWVAKKRKPLSDADYQPAAAAGPGSGACPRPAAAAAGEAGGAQPAAAAAVEQQAPGVELEGTAYLALLPNGSVTGHLVCAPSIFSPSRRSVGLMGEVVVAGRECTRDADWGVLRLTLVNFAAAAGPAAGAAAAAAAAAGEVSFLVERTEGDAMRLRAPVPWTGIELEELPGLDAACSLPSSAPGLALDFRCDRLLSGPPAEALLARLQPSLAGRGAAVNVGPMRVVLPPEAAAALLPPPPAAGAAGAAAQRALQASPSAAAAAADTPPQEAQQAQRRLTGRGSGGAGRVKVDSGEDW